MNQRCHCRKGTFHLHRLVGSDLFVAGSLYHRNPVGKIADRLLGELEADVVQQLLDRVLGEAQYVVEQTVDRRGRSDSADAGQDRSRRSQGRFRSAGDLVQFLNQALEAIGFVVLESFFKLVDPVGVLAWELAATIHAVAASRCLRAKGVVVDALEGLGPVPGFDGVAHCGVAHRSGDPFFARDCGMIGGAFSVAVWIFFL